MTNIQQNDHGEWVPAIPEPMFLGWRLRPFRCSCGERFHERLSYEGHYALVHILGVSPR